jgi:hypothetical protein
VVLDAGKVMPQEKPNAHLVALHGIGLEAASRRQVPGLVAELAESASARASLEAAQAAYPLPNAGKILAEALTAL